MNASTTNAAEVACKRVTNYGKEIPTANNMVF